MLTLYLKGMQGVCAPIQEYIFSGSWSDTDNGTAAIKATYT